MAPHFLWSPEGCLAYFLCLSLARLLTEDLCYSFVLKGHPSVHSSLKFAQPGYPVHTLSVSSFHVGFGAVSGTPIQIPLDVEESPLTMSAESFSPCSNEAQVKNSNDNDCAEDIHEQPHGSHRYVQSAFLVEPQFTVQLSITKSFLKKL